MPILRDSPYSKFKFVVSFVGGQGADKFGQIVGGFSDASGLDMGMHYSDYRASDVKFQTVRKVPNAQKFDAVILKRGLIGADDLLKWFNTAVDGTPQTRQVQIIMFDEARNPVVAFTLHNARPMKYTGPALSAKGGGDVAVEELSLGHEGIENM